MRNHVYPSHSSTRLSSWLLLLLLLQACHLSNAFWVATPTTTTTATTLSQQQRRVPSSSTTVLHHGRSSGSGSSVGEEENTASSLLTQKSIRFLGRGSNAVVRPGCVLVAPSQEFHHYYRRAAILVHAMGEADDGTGDYMIRGLILDHPTPFTLAEMMEHNPTIVSNPLGHNLLFRGGDRGGDGVILLHAQADFGRPEIGTSGLYEGGWQQALDMCATSSSSSSSSQADNPTTGDHALFKAFFNYCEFTEQELEDLMDSVEDGDAWVSLEVPADFCLDSDYDRGDAWTVLRNVVQQMQV